MQVPIFWPFILIGGIQIVFATPVQMVQLASDNGGWMVAIVGLSRESKSKA